MLLDSSFNRFLRRCGSSLWADSGAIGVAVSDELFGVAEVFGGCELEELDWELAFEDAIDESKPPVVFGPSCSLLGEK